MASARVTRFELDYDGIGEVLRSQEVRDELTGRAEHVLTEASVNAPFDTGEYLAGLHIEQITTDRAVVRVSGDSDHDWIVEANTGNLARSLDAAKSG